MLGGSADKTWATFLLTHWFLRSVAAHHESLLNSLSADVQTFITAGMLAVWSIQVCVNACLRLLDAKCLVLFNVPSQENCCKYIQIKSEFVILIFGRSFFLNFYLASSFLT